jgi:peptide/nickel transport system permease protein
MTQRVVLRRLLQIGPTVFGILLVGFLLIHIAPGDPILALAGEHGDAQYYAFLRQRFGLDLPLPQQFGRYIARVASGDFGASYVYGQDVRAIILERLPATLLLTTTALVLSVAIAVPLGVLAAQRPTSWQDLGITGAALTVYSTPVFWLGQLAIMLFASTFGALPVQGMTSAGQSLLGRTAQIQDVARHLVLPALVLAAHEVAVLVRVTRASLMQELTQDYVRTARAKGASEMHVLLRHALPSALLPLITVVGARAGQLVAGAAVVEVVFGWPGIGQLLLSGLQSRDIPVLLGLFMMIAFTVALANLATDVLHVARDKRIRIH